MMVLITTFVTPPVLRALLAKQAREDAESALCDLVTEALQDGEERREGERSEEPTAVR